MQFASLSTSEKIKLLNKEFDRIDVNHDQVLTYQELCNSLDDIGQGKIFDRDVARQLYDEMDKNHDGTISRKEFIDVFLKAEKVLKEKINQCRIVIADCEQQRSEAVRKLDEARRTEKYNQYGIKFGSVVAVATEEVSELRQIRPGQEVYVRALCGEDFYEGVSGVYKQDKAVIHDNINIAITTGKEIIQIVVSAVTNGQLTELGGINLPVDQLYDQGLHGGTYDLQTASGVSVGKINFTLQWIHSSVKYLEGIIQKWNEHIENTKADENDYYQDLEALYEPFKGLRGLFEMSKSDLEDPFLRWLRYGTYVTVGMLSFAFLACFARNAFLDLLIGLIYLLCEQRYFQETEGFKGLFIAAIVSLAYDIPWLSIYSNGWSGDLSPGEEQTVNTRIFSLVMSYFLFGVKLLVVYVYWRVDKEYQIFRQNNVLAPAVTRDQNRAQPFTAGQPRLQPATRY